MRGKSFALGAALLAAGYWAGAAHAGDLFRLRLDGPAATPGVDGGDTMTLAMRGDAAATTPVRWGHGGWGGWGHRGFGGWGGWGHRGWGWGGLGYRGFGGWGWGRGWGYGGFYRPWGGYYGSFYRPWGYYGGWARPYFGLGYGLGWPYYSYSYYYPSYSFYYPSYYYPIGTTVQSTPPTTPLTLPPRNYVPAPAPDALQPPAAAQPNDGTFPYDGGPQNPVPLPQQTQPQPQKPVRQPAVTQPFEGRLVSLPARTSKHAYPAYGEQPRGITAGSSDRLVQRTTR